MLTVVDNCNMQLFSVLLSMSFINCLIAAMASYYEPSLGLLRFEEIGIFWKYYVLRRRFKIQAKVSEIVVL